MTKMSQKWGPEVALSKVEKDLKATSDDIRHLEGALRAESGNSFLMKKYEALLKDRHILLEGRNESISESHAFLIVQVTHS